jgi:hypothetical protein
MFRVADFFWGGDSMPAGSLMHDCMIFSTHNDKVSITET